MADDAHDELSPTITRYHREIEHLLDLIEERPPGDTRREELVEKLFVEVMRHQVAEVTFLDPLIACASTTATRPRQPCSPSMSSWRPRCAASSGWRTEPTSSTPR